MATHEFRCLEESPYIKLYLKSKVRRKSSLFFCQYYQIMGYKNYSGVGFSHHYPIILIRKLSLDLSDTPTMNHQATRNELKYLMRINKSITCSYLVTGKTVAQCYPIKIRRRDF